LDARQGTRHHVAYEGQGMWARRRRQGDTPARPDQAHHERAPADKWFLGTLDEACFAVVTRDGRDHNWRRSDEQVGDVRSLPCGPGITAVQAARPASSRVPMTQEANKMTASTTYSTRPTHPTPRVSSSIFCNETMTLPARLGSRYQWNRFVRLGAFARERAFSGP